MVVAIAIILLLGALMMWLVRLSQQRHRVAKEWKERAAQPPDAYPSDDDTPR